MENSFGVTEMKFNPESALKVLQQQLESFEVLRQQTLQNASSVQNEINEIFNRGKLDASSHQFRPLQPSLNCNCENPQLSKAINNPGGTSSQRPYAEQKPATDKTGLLHDIHVNKMNEVLIQNRDSLLQSSEDILETPMPVSLMEEFPFRNTSLQHTGNQIDCKTSLQISGTSSACRSAAHSPVSNFNSSPTKQPVDGHNRGMVLLLQYNDESRAILEKICIASAQIKLQPERSEKWEMILRCELQRLRTVAQVTGKATGAKSTQTAPEISFSIESLNLEIEVENKAEKVLELETLVIRLQNTMGMLEKCNLDLHRQLGRGCGSNSPLHRNHWIETANKMVIPNQKLIQNQIQNLKSQNDDKINEFTTLYEKHESSSNNELTPLFKTSERPGHVCHMEKQREHCTNMIGEKKTEINSLADECTSWLPLPEYGNKACNGLWHEEGKVDVKSRAEDFATTFDSVLQENTECKRKVSQLEEERRTLKLQFTEMEEKRNICIEEFNALLRRQEGLRNQNEALEADREQLTIEKGSIQRLMEKMMGEKEDLLAVIGAKETILQLERTKEAVHAVNANALQLENQKMNQSLNELKKEIAFLKNELEKASCEIQCTRAKYFVLRTKNLMLFQLVQEVRDKNQKLEQSLQNSVTTNKSLQREVDEAKMERSPNEIERAKQGMVMSSSGSCSGDLVRKCEMLSKVVEMLTEENQILNQDLEKYIKANVQLESTVRVLDEEWLVLGNHTQSIKQEMNVLNPEIGHGCPSCLINGNNAAQTCRQGREDEMSDNQLNLSDIPFNGTNLSFGPDFRMTLCSSPKDQAKIDEIRRNFEELHGEQRYKDTMQHYDGVPRHNTTITDWKIQNNVGGSGDASQILNDQSFPSLSVKQHSHGSDEKSSSPLLQNKINWTLENLDSCIEDTLKVSGPQN
ncbi:coiled-coil domain-containing protein 110-like isoform X2 [Scyliorhinus canicula]|uniref:coiled-coil domain-containing protein 110-like isoform X2 n=1 Tax=Scyliorhinus canicula TaxID=7830 RepID=UPI0018F36264|nr:coiled-coil domain-containing protein 110-like isoform X2 [Scyliorhinus canicula]